MDKIESLDLAQFFPEQQWQIIESASEIADHYGWELYAVGGIVRDCLMKLNKNSGNLSSPVYISDIDLVVDGGEKSGIKIAIALHQKYPEAKLQTYPKFQTALLAWQNQGRNFNVDIATARTEIYPEPGANPQVQASSIQQDLYRRDFTINALAVRISDRTLIDLFGGCQDLAQNQIRAIRSGSFAEDPRRMFRAVRFAVRFNFKIAPETESEIKAVTASGLHHEIGGSRLKAELHYIFAHKQAVVMLRSLDQLGALRCLDSQLHLPKDFSLQIRRLRRWLQWFSISDPDAGLKLLRSYSEKAAKSPKELLLCENLKAWELSLPLPSQIVKVLRNYEAIALIIVAAQCSKPQRSILWQYLTKWQRVQPLLSGEDLKNLGYPEGKTLGNLLSQIRDATLDHKITTKAEAIALINRDQAVQNSST